MKVIDAFWEQRNLGMKCAEIEFETSDDVSCCAKAFEEVSSYDYLVAKISAGNPAILHSVRSQGFEFVECSLHLRHELKQIGNYHIFEAPILVTAHQAIKEDDVTYILKRVQDGLFNTDRIYLDPAFSHEQAARRYVNWIQDELAKGSILFDVFCDNCKVGFYAYKETEEHVSYPFLIGLYPEYRGRHLGPELIKSSLLTSAQRGCVRSDTVVSSNNPGVIRCQEHAGSYISEIMYVMVKHQN